MATDKLNYQCLSFKETSQKPSKKQRELKIKHSLSLQVNKNFISESAKISPVLVPNSLLYSLSLQITLLYLFKKIKRQLISSFKLDFQSENGTNGHQLDMLTSQNQCRCVINCRSFRTSNNPKILRIDHHLYHS